MKKQHTQKMTVRVTAQTAYNLERLMLMSGQKTPGRVVDKLVREKMLALRGRNKEPCPLDTGELENCAECVWAHERETED